MESMEKLKLEKLLDDYHRAVVSDRIDKMDYARNAVIDYVHNLVHNLEKELAKYQQKEQNRIERSGRHGYPWD